MAPAIRFLSFRQLLRRHGPDRELPRPGKGGGEAGPQGKAPGLRTLREALPPQMNLMYFFLKNMPVEQWKKFMKEDIYL